MAKPVVWSTIHLGKFADMDTDEKTYEVEDASDLLRTFGSDRDPLSHHVVEVATLGGKDEVVSTDNDGTKDSVKYDLGDGSVAALVDSVVLLAGIVTFRDGSQIKAELGVFQDDSGHAFLMVLDDQPELVAQAIDSIRFVKVLNSNYSGLQQFNKDDHKFVCFGPGTLIDTPMGPRRADRLAPGDLVTTLDDGPQPIRWIGKRRMRFGSPDSAPPVVIRKDALGPDLPRRDLVLSPDHRILVRTRPGYLLHEPEGALAPAKAFLRQPGIRPRRGTRLLTYFSLLLPRHAVIVAEGIAIESLFPGPEAFARLTGSERAAWMRLAAGGRITGQTPARLMLSTTEARAGLDSGQIALPDTPPVPRPWHARNPPLEPRLQAIA
jgi:hypothetical protein